MKEFGTCISNDTPMKTLDQNWKFWIPKIIKKAKLETGGRSTLFQANLSIVNELAVKSSTELLECK